MLHNICYTKHNVTYLDMHRELINKKLNDDVNGLDELANIIYKIGKLLCKRKT